MGVLVFSGQFLVKQHNILPVIKRKAEESAVFRFAVGDETSPAVIQRAVEEGTTGGLEGRIQMMRRYLSKVAEVPNVEIRTHGTILCNSGRSAGSPQTDLDRLNIHTSMRLRIDHALDETRTQPHLFQWQPSRAAAVLSRAYVPVVPLWSAVVIRPVLLRAKPP